MQTQSLPHVPSARPESYFRVLLRILATLGLLVCVTSCGRSGDADEEVRIKAAFDSLKSALLNHQPDQATARISRDMADYLTRLKAESATPTGSPQPPADDDSPGVDLLLRTALEKKVPADLRAGLTLDTLIQRIDDKRLLNLHEIDQITIGAITVNGKKASSEIYYQGSPTALYLHFIKEDDVWKVDVMAIIPYAEFLLRVDRAYTRKTPDQQIDQLVSKLPSL